MTPCPDPELAAWHALVSAPTDPPPTVVWAVVQDRAGTALPRDYCHYIDCFGLGCVNEVFWVLHPDGHPDRLNLFDQWAACADPAATSRLLTPPPHALGRIAGGLLPCAVDEDAGILYWYTAAADPDDWTVVYRDEDGGAWLHYSVGLVAFLHTVFTGGFPELGYQEAGFIGRTTTFERDPFA